MKHFVFCHGLGLNQTFWHKLAPLFVNEKCTYLDLGYFSTSSNQHISQNRNEISIGVGHSLGLLKLLNIHKKFDCLIGLNSFINFLGYNPTLRIQRNKELYLFKKSLNQSPINFLKTFYVNCGLTELMNTHDSEKINMNHIHVDIELLSMQKTFINLTPTLILGSENDIIVPPNLLYDNFSTCKNVKLEVLQEGQHALGFSQAPLIRQKIINFADTCSR